MSLQAKDRQNLNPATEGLLRKYILRATGCAISCLLLLSWSPMTTTAVLFTVLLGVAALGICGIWYSLRARSLSKKSGLRPASMLVNLGISSLSTALALVTMVGWLAFPQMRDYTECMRGANTNTARNYCQDQFTDWAKW